MSTPIDNVNVLDAPGLYRLTSSSSSVYYIDTRDVEAPKYLRAHGKGHTQAGWLDDAWQPLLLLQADTIEWTGERYLDFDEMDYEDTLQWTIRVGSRHVFHSHRLTGSFGYGGPYWMASRPCLEIYDITEGGMPPNDDLTIDEREYL